MTNATSIVASANQRFRPENSSHFKEVAKNISWLLERPLSKCQEDLARIYGYADLHELQQVLKKPGTPGPFEPRYNCFGFEQIQVVQTNGERIFFYLFGIQGGYWREDLYYSDKSFLVFEMGLFQEASEHRACFEKIRQVLSHEVPINRWPLIHGWPLGLKSWLFSKYTEPYDLAPGWQEKLSPNQECYIENADIRHQRFSTGLTRLNTLFGILAPRIGSAKPKSISNFDFYDRSIEGGGITDSYWEEYTLIEWLTEKSSKKSTTDEEESIIAFVQRPSRLTASSCPYVKNLKDPVSFRDRWAFESIKSSIQRFEEHGKAVYQSNFEDGFIASINLRASSEDVAIGGDYGADFWRLSYTYSKLIDHSDSNKKPILQPVIHSNGSLVTPIDSGFVAINETSWYRGHDATEFASEEGAIVFHRIYLKAIGVSEIFMANDRRPYSVIEIDSMLVEKNVTIENLTDYFSRLLRQFEFDNIPDAIGSWAEILELSYEDTEENSERNQDGEFASYIYPPLVILVNVEGCGFTSIEANHKNGKPISFMIKHSTENQAAKALADMVLSATKQLGVDFVIYDARMLD